MTDVEIGGPVGLYLPAAAFSQPPASTEDAFDSPHDASSQDSSVSHHIQPVALKHAASDVSRLADPLLPDHALTPPSSNASITDDHNDRHSKLPETAIALPTSVPSADPVGLRKDSLSPHSSSSREGIAGSKRTANGEVKSVPDGQSGSTQNSNIHQLGRERSGSAVSTSSANVTEISSQLRTKLKYAMLKVQNGWQTRSIDELESIASASPRSTISGFQHVHDRQNFASPQHQGSPHLQRTWSDSSSSESGPSDLQNHRFQPRHAPALQQPPNLQGSRSLAPPADIKPGARRRPTPNDAITLSGMAGSPLFTGQALGGRPSKTQRTPSQNAAMEADAVETLLFMASPSNSGYRPSQASQESSLRSTLMSQTSPLRAQFSQTSVTSPKKVAFSPQVGSTTSRSREAQIEHELDTLADDSEDDLRSLPTKTEQHPS